MYKGLTEELARKTDSRILLAVIDGVGDVSNAELGGRTPLEAAETPNLDRIASESALGLHIPVSPGITPGSGPAHLALFGYDPVAFDVGRGVLAALGMEFDLEYGDLVARINFCTVDDDGVVTDRRAGRISTERCIKLVELLSDIEIRDVETFVFPVKQHRACIVFRGEGLDDNIEDTDPGLTGEKPVNITGPGKSARVVREFIIEAGRILHRKHPANFIILRGFSLYAEFPSIRDCFRLTPAVAALYPMYKGVARLAGMDVLKCEPEDLDGQARAAANALESGHDFIFLHHKPADSAGEDGNVPAKIKAIEEFDRHFPSFLKLGFDVVCVTGDHSTPCPMKLHSWHPVPVLINGGPQRVGYSKVFSEREALSGALGSFRATDLMPLLLASAGKLAKFGA